MTVLKYDDVIEKSRDLGCYFDFFEIFYVVPHSYKGSFIARA